MPVRRLPERLGGPGFDLRLARVDDAPAIDVAVRENTEHLRPWMPWIAEEPIGLERRRAMLARWEEDWEGGGDLRAVIHAGGELVGICGLHRRIGPDALEIGYWVDARHLGNGYASTAARLLTVAGLSEPGVHHVEIHHDKANERSGRVPRRLGYRFVGEEPDEVSAPGEVGINCIWRASEGTWDPPAGPGDSA
jgi:RimJ/RimL family protein N-acetyltransferase